MAGTRIDRSKKPYSRPPTGPRRRSDGEWAHDKSAVAPTSRRAPGNAIPTQPAGNTRLVVSNLHYEVTIKDLIAIFGQIGTLVREPIIRYDRSGRSSGVALVTYESTAEAKRALNEYNGKLCKGQPMALKFNVAEAPRPQAHRSTSTPSLLNRIQKPPLLERLTQKEPKPKPAPRAPAAPSNGVGPIRTKPRVAKAARVPKEPKSAEELDMELEAFMKDDTQPAPVAQTTEGDVEMTG